MSRKKKDHQHMSADAAVEGYVLVLRDMFSADVGTARLLELGPEITKMRSTLEALSSDGKFMKTETALFLVMQTMTWLVEGMVAKLIDDCGHEECAKSRMSGLSQAMGLVVAELLTQGRKMDNLSKGVTH